MRSIIPVVFVGAALLGGLSLSTCQEVESVTEAKVGMPVPKSEDGNLRVDEARKQIGVTETYDPAYVGLSYPNGDVPRDRGVCTDVVIRALRDAHGYDLQKVVHEDMKRNFSKYPKIWKLKGPDKNIDHRRVPNLQKYFERKGWKTTQPAELGAWRAGDLVTCLVPGNRPHIMIVSDRATEDGRPLMIHNIGAGTREEDCLEDFKITGVYRPKPALKKASSETQ